MAEDSDSFVLETTKPLPDGKVPGEEVDYKTFIKENILAKTNEELSKVHTYILLDALVYRIAVYFI